MKTYRVIGFVAEFKGGLLGAKGDPIEQQMQAIINRQASEGWSFVGLQTAHYSIKPGCLAGLFGKPEEQGSYDVLVFEK